MSAPHSVCRARSVRCIAWLGVSGLLLFGLGSIDHCIGYRFKFVHALGELVGREPRVGSYPHEANHANDVDVERSNPNGLLHSFAPDFLQFDMLLPVGESGLDGKLAVMPALIGSAIEQASNERGNAGHQSPSGGAYNNGSSGIELHSVVLYGLLGGLPVALLFALVEWVMRRKRL